VNNLYHSLLLQFIQTNTIINPRKQLFFQIQNMDFFNSNNNYMDIHPEDFIKSLLFYIVCIFFLSIIVYILYNITIKIIGVCGKAYESFRRRTTKEGMSPSSRWNRSARYLNRYNGLIPQNRQYTSSAMFPIDHNPRGDHVLQYLLKQEAGKPQSNGSPESVSVLGISTKTTVPDTSALPAAVQSGVVENASEVAQYTNPRTNPVPSILTQVKLSPTGNIEGNSEDAQSRVSEGFRRRRLA
jgi:hypothetical protein